MRAQPEGFRPEIVVAIEGTFDPMAASALRARLAKATPATPVVLDFSRAREVSDLGVALLAHGLATAGRGAVRFRGLSQHHERMLRYLGLDLGASGKPHALNESGVETR